MLYKRHVPAGPFPLNVNAHRWLCRNAQTDHRQADAEKYIHILDGLFSEHQKEKFTDRYKLFKVQIKITVVETLKYFILVFTENKA